MTAKTNAERQADFAERQREAGLKLLRNFWARPENEARIREYAAKLDRKSERQA